MEIVPRTERLHHPHARAGRQRNLPVDLLRPHLEALEPELGIPPIAILPGASRPTMGQPGTSCR
jgi:hypothetical protein